MRLYKSLRLSVCPFVRWSVAVYKNEPNCHIKAILALYCPCPTARDWAYAVYTALFFLNSIDIIDMINKKWSWKWEKNTTTKKKMRYIACYDYHSQLTVLQKAPSTLCRNFWNVLKDCWQTLPLTFAISLIFSIGVAFFLALFNSLFCINLWYISHFVLF